MLFQEIPFKGVRKLHKVIGIPADFKRFTEPIAPPCSLPGAMASFLHTCYRIGDIDRSVAFYSKLGFEEVARMPIGDEAINVFMGMPGEDPRLELTYNHGVDSYELGSGYNHIALAVDDLDGTLERLAAEGIDPERPPYRPGNRTEGHRICFVRDPDGYRIELIGE
jgi:lactoylglutathione lyase